MAGFDDLGIYFADNLGTNETNDEFNAENVHGVKRKFKEFLKEFHEGNYIYKYRDELKNHVNIGQFWIEISLEDLSSFDEDLCNRVKRNPTEYLHVFEEAAKEVAYEITRPRSDILIDEIQVMLDSNAHTISLRQLKSDFISKLVKIPGLIISASNVRAKATKISLQCRGCNEIVNNLELKPGLEGFLLPRKCNSDQTGRTLKCPVDPFYIMPDKCKCIDYQLIKLQETPEAVPQGEMPRHLQVYLDRYLCEKVVPGNRVTIIGIYSVKKISAPSKGDRSESAANIGIRAPYLRVIGVKLESENGGRNGSIPYTAEEEILFKNLARSPDIFERITKSVAPSIYGYDDMKKAVTCLLFSGSRKRLPDGLTRRGDINVLFLGDPGTAKSQLLKFAEKVAPIGVYTSGKGSSAAGLTASVIRDPASKNFVIEGGAMIIADGGLVCIDEFDKMKEDDRVAIHEALEQQTISIAKAGITTTLNSRCAVLAAANSVFGRWDDTKAENNIDFMPTILSRFDMIFIVKDEHNEKRDMTLAKHVLNLHANAQKTIEETPEGELSLNLLKKYISYCRSTCGPRLDSEAAAMLKKAYVEMRNGTGEDCKKLSIPLTVRQLEALIRISESLAKIELQAFATKKPYVYLDRRH